MKADVMSNHLWELSGFYDQCLILQYYELF